MAVTVLAPSEDSGRVTPTLKTGRRRLAVQPAPGKVDVDQEPPSPLSHRGILARHATFAPRSEAEKAFGSPIPVSPGARAPPWMRPRRGPGPSPRRTRRRNHAASSRSPRWAFLVRRRSLAIVRLGKVLLVPGEGLSRYVGPTLYSLLGIPLILELRWCWTSTRLWYDLPSTPRSRPTSKPPSRSTAQGARRASASAPSSTSSSKESRKK